MSYIDNTRRNFSSPLEKTVCLTREECKILLPFFRKAYNINNRNLSVSILAGKPYYVNHSLNLTG